MFLNVIVYCREIAERHSYEWLYIKATISAMLLPKNNVMLLKHEFLKLKPPNENIKVILEPEN